MIMSRRARVAVEQWRGGVFPFRVRHISGSRGVRAGPDELVVVCLARDGAAYLAAFLHHYRGLGAKHIVLLDNGSTDGMVERAVREPGVTVLQTRAPYRNYKVIAKRYLVRRFGRANWVLCVDIDEFFDYPYRRRFPLQSFLRYLNAYGYTAVVAQLLDLFPRGALSPMSPFWRREHRYYDLSEIEEKPYREKYSEQNRTFNDRIVVYHGGIRKTSFGVRPLLTKHPLQFPATGMQYINSHNVRAARVADVSAVLLHYK